ncbi:hypothetical protein TNCV_2941661 [Trichonephila clavipes]|nr:hypothetical protein TNCV_2941661 [Trichonephila clavipes]
MGLRRRYLTDNGEKTTSNEKNSVYSFLQRYGVGQTHRVGRTEDSNNKLIRISDYGILCVCSIVLSCNRIVLAYLLG